MRKHEAQMKHIVTIALMLNFGVASVYAQQKAVNMKFSGTNVGTTIDLQPDTVTDDVNLAGNGTLGPFTYHELHADSVTPQSSPTCVDGTGLYIPTLAGGAVFRFQGGSLLTVELTEGALCIDLTAGVAHFAGSYKITGGTGRFKSASGTLTLTSTVSPVLFNASNAPVLLTNTGEITGTVSGVCREEDAQEEQQ
jgi:hypothetical protein